MKTFEELLEMFSHNKRENKLKLELIERTKLNSKDFELMREWEWEKRKSVWFIGTEKNLIESINWAVRNNKLKLSQDYRFIVENCLFHIAGFLYIYACRKRFERMRRQRRRHFLMTGSYSFDN